MKITNSENVVLTKSLDFAVAIVEFSETLEGNKKFVIANQLLKSGTSIGANIREAQHAESKSDFIHKLKIAAKEAEETEYWLLLCEKSKNYPSPTDLQQQLLELKKIIFKIIISTKAKSWSHFLISAFTNLHIR